MYVVQFSSVQSLSHVWLFVTPWMAALQASLSLTISQESAQTHVHWVSDAIQPSHPLSPTPFPSCPQSFPASGSFLMNDLFRSGGQSIGASASASVLPMNIQDWFPLELTGWISLQFKGLSRVFSNTVQVCILLWLNKSINLTNLKKCTVHNNCSKY